MDYLELAESKEDATEAEEALTVADTSGIQFHEGIVYGVRLA